MNHRILQLAPAALLIWFCGCAGTSIKQTWKSPDYHGGPVQKVAVLAMDERGIVRVALENRYVRDLRERGQPALACGELVDLAEIKTNKEAVTARLREAGADTILAVQLVDRISYNSQASGAPSLYGRDLYLYAGTWYDNFSYHSVQRAGVRSSTKREFYLDNSLFDLGSGQRLWSGLALLVLKEGDAPLDAADALSGKIVTALYKDGLIH